MDETQVPVAGFSRRLFLRTGFLLGGPRVRKRVATPPSAAERRSAASAHRYGTGGSSRGKRRGLVHRRTAVTHFLRAAPAGVMEPAGGTVLLRSRLPRAGWERVG